MGRPKHDATTCQGGALHQCLPVPIIWCFISKGYFDKSECLKLLKHNYIRLRMLTHFSVGRVGQMS